MSHSRRAKGGSILDVRAAVEGIFSCTHFETEYLTLPTKIGAQLSMTGEVTACGNRCTIDGDRLPTVLRMVSPYKKMHEDDAEEFASRKRFILLCGENSGGVDRTVAMIGAISEMIRAGAKKIVICTDDPHERYTIVQSLEVMRNVFGVTSYIPGEYDDGAVYTLSASVYSFLASPNPEVLVVGRDCITKRTNLVRRKNDGEDSLTELIARLHPVVITASRRVSSGRSLAEICRIFDPAMTFVFCDEIKRLRDAVIFVPEAHEQDEKSAENAAVPEQLCFCVK